MEGKRVGAPRRSGQYPTARPRRKRREKKARTWRSRLAVFGVGFALFLAVTSLFPKEFNEFILSASHLLGRSADFGEAFSAVGRTMSGADPVEDSLQDAYTAVFNPTPSSGETNTAGEVQEPDSVEAQPVSGAYLMAAIPENASLDMRHLGFSYTSPVDGRLTSAFGWREHPTEGGERFHYGLDLAADVGTEIVAFADGEIFAVGESSTLGKYIILRHAGAYRTLYAHCSEILVSAGAVSMGDVIALVGETGSTTGPHLHFELQDGALYLNPIYYVAIW